MGALKFGIVGAGFVAHFHVRAIQQVRGFEVAGVTSRSKARRDWPQVVSEQGLGEGVVYPSLAEMARHVDVIAIYAPNFARVEMVEELAQAVNRAPSSRG